MTAILVTGSTGTLGRALVPLLTKAGHEVRAFSRRPRPPSTPPQAWATGDLRANVGLDEALAHRPAPLIRPFRPRPAAGGRRSRQPGRPGLRM